MRATDSAEQSRSEALVGFCDRSEHESAASEARCAQINHDVMQSAADLVSAPITSTHECGEIARALAKYLELVGSEDHDAIVQAGLRQIAAFIFSNA